MRNNLKAALLSCLTLTIWLSYNAGVLPLTKDKTDKIDYFSNKSHEKTNQPTKTNIFIPLCHRPPLLNHTVRHSSIPHTPPCCCKYSQEHQMCINPQLKIVPN